MAAESKFPEHERDSRNPGDSPAGDEREKRERTLDKTLADSFPTSDPPSSIPDPCEDEAA